MANAFVVINCKQRKIILTTLSARKAQDTLKKGLKVEIWIDNIHFDTIYSRQIEKFKPFTLQEKQWIGKKQKAAERRNRMRKQRK